MTGDELISQLSLQDVSLIKIDTDGFDYPILKGFAATMDKKRPLFQFEYSRFWIEGGHFLKDAFELFDTKNYVIGRLMPNWIDWFSYSYNLETHLTNNYIAVPAEDKPRIEQLLKNR